MSAPKWPVASEVLVAGTASGPALLLEDTLSFWGGFDPRNGEIIDVHHPQYGQRVGGKILFVAESRGSAGTPAGIAEALRNGSGPLALVLGERDVNIGVGAFVANRLYQLEIPVVELSRDKMQLFLNGDAVIIDSKGRMSVGA